jgi:hypothetical protein
MFMPATRHNLTEDPSITKDMPHPPATFLRIEICVNGRTHSMTITATTAITRGIAQYKPINRRVVQRQVIIHSVYFLSFPVLFLFSEKLLSGVQQSRMAAIEHSINISRSNISSRL